MTSGSLTDAKALRRLAQLMDEDDARTGRVGIPISYGIYLVWQALAGPGDDFDLEYVRLCRTKGSAAAVAWGQELDRQYHRLTGLVYPDGCLSRPMKADEVRALADTLDNAA